MLNIMYSKIPTTYKDFFFPYLDNSPTRTIPHKMTGIGPDEWFYWLVVVLMGNFPSGEWVLAW